MDFESTLFWYRKKNGWPIVENYWQSSDNELRAHSFWFGMHVCVCVWKKFVHTQSILIFSQFSSKNNSCCSSSNSINTCKNPLVENWKEFLLLLWSAVLNRSLLLLMNNHQKLKRKMFILIRGIFPSFISCSEKYVFLLYFSSYEWLMLCYRFLFVIFIHLFNCLPERGKIIFLYLSSL